MKIKHRNEKRSFYNTIKLYTVCTKSFNVFFIILLKTFKSIQKREYLFIYLFFYFKASTTKVISFHLKEK